MTPVPDSSPDPPRIAERMLEWVITNPVSRHGLTGDLREAFGERCARLGRWSSVVWYWRQALSAGARYGATRLLGRARGWVGIRAWHAERSPMTRLWHDARHAVRALARSPGTTAVAIVALTLGIGMPTIMFSVLNGVFREMPVEEPERILRVVRTDSDHGGRRWDIGHHDFADWRTQQTSFVDLAGFTIEDVTLSGGDARPLRRNAAFVTPNAFEVLRVQPILGRSFRADDVKAGPTSVAIVSYALWQSRFAGDANVAGKTLTVDGIPHTVVGVMPARFGFPANEHVWLPLALSLDTPRQDSEELEVFGRLQDGVTPERARVELHTVASRLAQAFPESNRGYGADVVPYADGLVDDSFSRGVLTMFAAVAFVLLIACVNVANLLLARAIDRSKEIAVRRALGASRSRVVSLFLLESSVVAVVGGVLGTLVAWIGITSLQHALTSVVGVAWADIRIDGAVLAFVLGVVLLGSVLAGILPAWQASQLDVNADLKDASRRVTSTGLRIGRVGRGLVVVEIALSCALLGVSGLLIKGVLKLKAVDLGMPVEEILTGEVELPRPLYSTPESRVRFFEELEAAAGLIPGVRSAALMSDIPGTIGYRMPVSVDATPDEPRRPRVGVLTVTPGFVSVLGTRVVDGRGFTPQDRFGSEPVVIVNQRFADQFLPGRRAVGHTVQLGREALTVVGVVPDLYMGSMDEPDANGPGLYLPFGQSGNVSMQLVVRTVHDPLHVASELEDVLVSLNPNLALMNIDRVDRIIQGETAVFEVFGRLFLVFGAVALFLASMGLYGVMSFTVRQRTREWGVRIALGATARDVLRLATRQATLHLIVGLAVGLVVAGLLSKPLASFFYQVEPWDEMIFGSVVFLMFVTGVLATLVPARRATRVDPLEALRHE